jgi:hypothetical protein
MELYEQRPGNILLRANSPQPVPAAIGDNEFIACCHYGVNGAASYHCLQYNYPTALSDRFHTWGILWDSLHVEYYFDDTLFWGVDYPVVNGTNFGVPNINLPENEVTFHSPFYWIINVEVGGSYQGQNINTAIFPTKMELDYVRVYQKGIVKTVNKDIKQPISRSFELINPSTAQLKLFDLNGKLVADYSSKVKRMKAGDNVMKMLPPTLSNGTYMVKLVDNGVSASRILVTAR